MELYCCGCENNVDAKLTDGAEIYPHRPDLETLPFWKCDACNNFVGCHHKTKDRTRPLGCIPTIEIKKARQHIHKLLDPLWQDGNISRKALYERISNEIGWKYHTGNIRSIEEARKVYKILCKVKKEKEIDRSVGLEHIHKMQEMGK